MSQASKTRLLKCTDEQDAALTALTGATGETYADLVRRLLKDEAAKHNIVFPMNMPTKGETIRKARQTRWNKDE